MPLKFVVTKDPSGEFSFAVISRNGQVLVRSDAYRSKAGALGAIRSLKSQAEGAAIEDQTTKAWLDAEAGRQAAAPAKPATAKKAAPAPAPAEPEEAEEAASLAEPEPEPEPEVEPEPEPERPTVFAEPPAYEAGEPMRRVVSLRGATEPVGRSPHLVSLRNP